MGRYLDKFAGVIGKRQSEQIFSLLNRQRNSGQIRSLDEFSAKLESLVRELTSTTLQPSLKLWKGEKNQEIDSESYNFMLDRVQDDLSAAFEEATKIDEVQLSHEAIVRDVILKNLAAGIAELESKVTLFEFLNKDLRGFDAAIFSTFRESKNGRTTREAYPALFFDPRLNEVIPEIEDATVELVGERLVLSVSNNVFHTISDVRQIFDSESPQSELVVEPSMVSMRSMLDNTPGTFWTQTTLFSTKPEYVKTKLEFKLGSVKEVNVIEVDTASKYGLILEAIHYANGNNEIVDLGIPERTIESVASIRIKKIATNRLILTFRNEHPTKVNFKYSPTTSTLFSQAFQNTSTTSNSLAQINQDLNTLIPSTKIKQVLKITEPTKSIFNGYSFVIGIDNVRVGVTRHESRSVYISTPLQMTDLGQIGIKTLESRPYIEDNEIKFTNTTYDIDQDSSLVDDSTISVGDVSNTWFQGSIEYWIIKMDKNVDEVLQKMTVFPLLPLNVDRVYHEYLMLNAKSDSSLDDNNIGTLVFYTSRTEGNVMVYRNGILITDATGNGSATEGWQDISTQADRTPNNGSSMIFKLKILDRLPGDIFTVSYTPVVSSTHTIPTTLGEVETKTGLKVVDLVGDLTARVVDGQIVFLDRNNKTGSTDLYLSIILRLNTAETALTPSVEEYTLVAGSKDLTKFEEP